LYTQLTKWKGEVEMTEETNVNTTTGKAPVVTEESRAKQSAAMKKKWEDPAYREAVKRGREEARRKKAEIQEMADADEAQ